jgi:hypothetical protein
VQARAWYEDSQELHLAAARGQRKAADVMAQRKAATSHLDTGDGISDTFGSETNGQAQPSSMVYIVIFQTTTNRSNLLRPPEHPMPRHYA